MRPAIGLPKRMQDALTNEAVTIARANGFSDQDIESALAEYPRRDEAAASMTSPAHAPRARLFSIIDAVNRPSFVVRNGDFDASAHAAWASTLSGARTVVRSALPLVGQIWLDGQALGTVYAVRPGVILTNHHVAKVFVDFTAQPPVLKFDATLNPTRLVVDFGGESAVVPVPGARITRVIIGNQATDLALLACDGTPTAVAPLTIASAIQGSTVVAIGFPSPETAYTPEMREVHERVFGTAYRVKRVAPGIIKSIGQGDFEHDCSTLGGSSGSAMIDIATGDLVGLHKRGGVQSNRAAPSDAIRDLLSNV